MVELVTEIFLWLVAGYVLDNLELTPSGYGNCPSYSNLKNGCEMYTEGTEGTVGNRTFCTLCVRFTAVL